MASKGKETPNAARYQIDVGWYQRSGKDLGELLTNRRCAPCRKEINGNPAKPPTAKEHFTRFSKCCGAKDEYLGEYMGIKEIVFRILARDRNQAKTVGSIYKDLSAHLQSRSYSRVIPSSWLAKMLDADETYGIHAV